MTPNQFKRKLHQLGLRTQTEAAMALGITQAAVSYYLSGDRPIPEMAVKLLSCIESNPPPDTP